MDISGGDVERWRAAWERRDGLRLAAYRRRRRASDSSDSTSSTSATSDSPPLARFNRLLVKSIARHWGFFRGSRLIPAGAADARPRSISDVGISDIASAGGGGSEYAPAAAGGRGCRSSSHADVPTLRVTAAATETEQSDFSDAERHGGGTRLLVPRSTGNFVGAGGGGGGGGGGAGGGGASAAPRSAPATPLQLEPHPRHLAIAAGGAARNDKNAVKQLSSSAPSVRAGGVAGGGGGGGGGGGSAEGDSGESKAPSKTPSKARQKKFLRHFPQVGPDERVLNYYSCALVGDILLQGHLYITKNYFAFYSNVFGYVTKLLIPTALVLRVSKEKMARIIPNAVGVCTRDERHVFGSLLSRDSTYKLMLTVWRAAAACEQATPQPQEELRVSEVELDASEYSPGDESSSGGGEAAALHPRCARRPSPAAASASLPHQGDAVGIGSAKSPAVIQPTLLLGGGVGGVGAEGRARGGGGGGAGGRLAAAALALLALALAASAVTLAHTIYRQRHAATMPTQGDLMRLRSADMYGELLAWQARLHSQAASEVHTFLNTNLHLLAKVRQSLEALSTMILTDAGKQTADALRFDSSAAPPSDNRPQPGVS